jgi:hypothetical protein
MKKYSYFKEKIKGWRNIQNCGQKPKWRWIDFLTEIQLKRHLTALLDNCF